MKKHLTTLCILMLLLVACSDSEEKDNEPGNPNHKYRNTPEYARLGLSAFGLKGDVKTVTTIEPNNYWSEVDGEWILSSESSVVYKRVREFDEQGFIAKELWYSAPSKDANPVYTLTTTSSYEYDDVHRLLSYKHDGDTRKGFEVNEYNDETNELTHVIYETEDGETRRLHKIVIPLDKDGRYGGGHHYVINYDPVEAMSARAEELPTYYHMTQDKVIYEDKDKKGNVTLEYKKRTVKQPDPETGEIGYHVIYIDQYKTHQIEYYDGASSETMEQGERLEGGAYVVAITRDSEGLKGKVKSRKVFTSYDAVWDPQTQTITSEGTFGYPSLYVYNEAGLLILQENEYDDLKIIKEWAYDSRSRMTLVQNKLMGDVFVRPDEQFERIDKEIISYNDANKTATVLTFISNEGKENFVSKTIYKLASDGTISLDNYEKHLPSQARSLSANSIPDFETTPSHKTERLRVKEDSNGNALNVINLHTSYDSEGKPSSYTVKYFYKYEYTYY